MRAIGKKSVQPLITTIIGVIGAGLMLPLTIRLFSLDNTYAKIFLSIFYLAWGATIIYNAFFLIILPRDIIILDEENKTVTIYLTRTRKKVLRLDDIQYINMRRPTIAYRRVVTHLLFETKSGEKVVARFITNGDGVIYTVLKK